jgi:hypothetical protein
MDRIHYAGNSILTGTTIAHALLDYAQALAQVGASATVDIPTLNDDGTLGRSEVLIGPASQLISTAEESRFDDVTDVALVALMGEEAKRLRQHGSPSPTATIRDRNDMEDWAPFEL